ncbi:MAG TPA: hypothetical protein VN853_22595 [Polyangia bacterium]|nr:hypothetical protein [Polyangia bacterium]
MVVISLVVVAAACGAVIALAGPRLAAGLARGGGIVATAKRKLKALRDYALFRAPGDKAVLNFDRPDKTHAKKQPAH